MPSRTDQKRLKEKLQQQVKNNNQQIQKLPNAKPGSNVPQKIPLATGKPKIENLQRTDTRKLIADAFKQSRQDKRKK